MQKDNYIIKKQFCDYYSDTAYKYHGYTSYSSFSSHRLYGSFYSSYSSWYSSFGSYYTSNNTFRFWHLNFMIKHLLMYEKYLEYIRNNDIKPDCKSEKDIENLEMIKESGKDFLNGNLSYGFFSLGYGIELI